MVINNQSNTFSVLDGNGDGTFAKSRDFIAGNAPLAAVAGDFYGSGHVDLAIINHASQTVSLPGGNGDGTFKAARSYVSGQQPTSIASGILNGGKTQGLVVANYCGSDLTCASAGNVAVFLADASGAYRLSSTYMVGAGPVSVALADLNGDKNLDIVVANRLDKTVFIKGDQRAKYEIVLEVVQNLQAAGVDMVGLLTEQQQEKGKSESQAAAPAGQ